MDGKQAAKRCARDLPSGKRCGSWAARGSDYCRWHQPPPPVHLLVGFGPSPVPEPVMRLPEGLRLTAEGVPRLCWYRRLLVTAAERSVAGSLERMPRLEGEEEPSLVIGSAPDAWRLPIATLFFWLPDGIYATVGAERTYRVAAVKGSPDRATAAMPAEAERAAGGELSLRLRWGGEAPYLGLTHWDGRFLILASPEVPWSPFDVEERDLPPMMLPDLRVLDHSPAAWSRLAGRETEGVARRRLHPGRLPQPTFPEARAAGCALADGPTLRHWSPLEGEVALRHRIPRDTLELKLTPGVLLAWLERPVTHASLEAELLAAGVPAVLLLDVALGLILQEPGPLTISLDDLIALIGQAPRTASERAEWRRRVWRWLLLFDAMLVIGRRAGRYPDRQTRQGLDLAVLEPLLKLGSVRPDGKGAEPPLEVTLVPGSWLERHRGDRRVLTEFGDVLRLTAIPAGRIAGRWAQAIGLALFQKWRETAKDATPAQAGETGRLTVRFPTMTRRELLSRFPPSPTAEAVLEGINPDRARGYWIEAIGILKSQRIIGYYSDPAKSSPTKRIGWQRAWLDQPLTIRPAGSYAEDAAAIARSARSARKKPRKPAR